MKKYVLFLIIFICCLFTFNLDVKAELTESECAVHDNNQDYCEALKNEGCVWIPSNNRCTAESSTVIADNGSGENSSDQAVQNNSLYDDPINLCEDYSALHTLHIIKVLITIAKLGVPLLLIIWTSLDIVKVVNDPDSLKKVKTIVLKRLLAAVIVFFVPTFLDVIVNIVNSSNNSESCTWSLFYENADNYNNYKPSDVSKASKTTTKRPEIPESDDKNAYKPSEKLNENNYLAALNRIKTPSFDELKKKAADIGVSEEYLKIIIGTTYGEGYAKDQYLSYGWASAFINNKYSISTIEGWPPRGYYYRSRILSEYRATIAADTKFKQEVLKSVYLALTNRNTKIIGCSGAVYNNSTRVYRSTAYPAIYIVEKKS